MWPSKLQKILYPHPALLAVLISVTAVGLVFVFGCGLENTAVAYMVYPLSAYAAAALVLRIIRTASHIRRILYARPLLRRCITDASFQEELSLRLSFCITLLYSLLKAAVAIQSHSPWFGSMAAYYLLLGVMRFLLLALTLALGAMSFYTIHRDEVIRYPVFLIYAAAAYAFYNVIMAILRLARRQKGNDCILRVNRTLSLATALVSLFFLQTSLLTAFGDGAPWQTNMNLLTGGSVFLAILCMAIHMIRPKR